MFGSLLDRFTDVRPSAGKKPGAGSPVRMCVVLSVLFVLVSGCGGQKNTYAPPPPPDVTVTTPQRKEVTSYLEETGTTQALEYVDIRARVPGFLTKINFEPRQRVKTGDLLFVIDPRPYEAKVADAKANVDGKTATLKLQQIELQKKQELYDKQAVPEIQVIEYTAHRDLAKADLESARAALTEAKLRLEYAHVTSPIEGRAGRNLVDIGNLVGEEEKTLLTTVVDDSKIYAYFSVSEVDFLNSLQGALKALDKKNGEKTEVEVGLANETGYPHTGRIDFIDTQVDPSTGTVKVRAVLPNPEETLMPGMFVRVRIPIETKKRLVIPDEAVMSDQAGDYVLIVKSDDTVERRRVTRGQQDGRLRVIEKGLTEKDRVIIEGLQQARPGSKVKPSLASAQTSDSDSRQ